MSPDVAPSTLEPMTEPTAGPSAVGRPDDVGSSRSGVSASQRLPDAPDARPLGSASAAASERLRQEALAMRLSFTWFGTRKTLTAEQKARAAEPFGAEHHFLSAVKKLVDTRFPKFQAVTAVRNQAVRYWKQNSLPFPEPGLRLIRRRDLQTIDRRMQAFREQLEQAVTELDEHFAELQQVARQRLGSLFDPADYPVSLRDQFRMTWDYPSVEPPPYLQWLDPELYRRESQRAAARFREAVCLAERMFLEELGRLVDHLTERLTGSDDGRPKVFRDSAVENLREFFDRFQRLNVRSSRELDELVERARSILGGVQPDQLRQNAALRQNVVQRLHQVQTVLDELLVDRPRRNIVRRPR